MNDINLGYKGNIKITYRIKGKVVEKYYHNEGLPNLFRIISKALTGASIYNERPTTIDLREKVNGSWQTLLNSGGTATALLYTQDSNGDWVARATTTISYSQLTTTTFSPSGEYRLYLSSQTGDLAYLPVDGSDLSNIEQGTQALVEWTLKVSNAT